MKLSTSLPSLLLLLFSPNLCAGAAVSPLSPAPLRQDPLDDAPHPPSNQRIPTSYESAILGRRILALTPIGTLSSVFPPSSSSSSSSSGPNRHLPLGLAGKPFGLMDYIADCESHGDPTILAVKIATTFRNAAAGSNVAMSMRWDPPFPARPGPRLDDPNAPLRMPYSAASLPRFALVGALEKIGDGEAEALKECFVNTHPDARRWLPGNRIHKTEFMRLVVREVYWLGGFGSTAFIGWIPVEEWRNVTREEWQAVRLPGETEEGLRVVMGEGLGEL